MGWGQPGFLLVEKGEGGLLWSFRKDNASAHGTNMEKKSWNYALSFT